jgi:hypothetical protein
VHDLPATVLGLQPRTNLGDWEVLHSFVLAALRTAETKATAWAPKRERADQRAEAEQRTRTPRAPVLAHVEERRAVFEVADCARFP